MDPTFYKTDEGKIRVTKSSAAVSVHSAAPVSLSASSKNPQLKKKKRGRWRPNEVAAMRLQGSVPLVEVVRLGLLPYREAAGVQRAYVKSCQEGTGHALLLCQHPPVYTTGIRQKEEPPAEMERLRLLGAQVHRADRGGLTTFHGPGQLVCYPVLHLAAFKKSIRWYVSQLERTVVAACRSFRVEASTSPYTGVWVGDNKICAIGVRCSRYVTSHGLALNCNTDLAWFRHIVPCGVAGKGVTSLSAELRRDVGVDEAVPHVLRAFADVFGCRLADVRPPPIG